MTKRVYRYFFDFLDGQTQWLNQMAAKGWRLVKCRQLSYEFEPCNPDEYEYSVEFVANKSFSHVKNYKIFLESMGYKILIKNLNVGVAAGKVKWRPWATGAGQIVTAPGGYFKELFIAEKKKDGKPFELHTDLTDKLSLYTKIRNACLWSVGSMLALLSMCLSFAVVNMQNDFWPGGILCAIAGIPAALCTILWTKPLRNIIHKVRKMEDDAKTYECEPIKKPKKILFAAIYIAFLMAIIGGISLFAGGYVGTISSGSVLTLKEDSGKTHWNASYNKLNGFRRRSVSLDEGTHRLTIAITTESGELAVSIKGKDGKVYYNEVPLPNSTFYVDIPIDAGSKERITLRVDAKKHTGSYAINWEG